MRKTIHVGYNQIFSEKSEQIKAQEKKLNVVHSSKSDEVLKHQKKL